MVGEAGDWKQVIVKLLRCDEYERAMICMTRPALANGREGQCSGRLWV